MQLGLEEVLMIVIGLGLIVWFEPVTTLGGLLLVAAAFGLDPNEVTP